jgi:inosine-uridine nucleoside N-ribohydrolase
MNRPVRRQSRSGRRFTALLGIFAASAGMALQPCLHADDELVVADNDYYGPATTNLQAALVLLNHPGLRVLGLTVVSGDGWRDEEVAHTLRLLEILGRADVPVVPGAVFPLINTQERTRLWEQLYGHLGWKGAWAETKDSPLKTYIAHGPFEVPPLAEGEPKIHASSQTAAAFLIEQVHKYPHRVSIYAGGPMTDLALAIRLDPEFASLTKQLVFMGATPGANINSKEAHAKDLSYNAMVNPDFNIFFDPEAAQIVLHAAWPKITAVGEVTEQVALTKELLARITAVKTPVTEYLAKYAQLGVPLWDEMTAAILADPSLVTRHQTFFMDVDIDHGAGYGTTRLYSEKDAPHLGEQPVDLVTDIDAARFTDEFVAAMQAKP